ncbi:MAG: hypothetical protein CVV45_08630 [Spirochaetae bacterium HGW-Spirochaetae-10]|nr:MAG: hypothetical protein CVV45_08630 [Spirochaetae bacterium HGW-Spirochaetae-10]
MNLLAHKESKATCLRMLPDIMNIGANGRQALKKAGPISRPGNDRIGHVRISHKRISYVRFARRNLREFPFLLNNNV